MAKIIIGSIAIFLDVSFVALLLGILISSLDDDVSVFEVLKRGYLFIVFLTLPAVAFAGLVVTIIYCFDLV